MRPPGVWIYCGEGCGRFARRTLKTVAKDRTFTGTAPTKSSAKKRFDPDALQVVWLHPEGSLRVTCPEHGLLGPDDVVERAWADYIVDVELSITIVLHPVR